MRKTTWLVLMLCVMVFGAVGMSYANGYTTGGTIYGCVNNNLGTIKIVNIETATKPYCGSLEQESLVMFQRAAGIDLVIYGHITSTGGQTTSSGANGFSVFHYPSSPGRYEIDFNLSASNLPTCTVTPATGQCRVTSKTNYSVTIDCVNGSKPVETDFDFICVD